MESRLEDLLICKGNIYFNPNSLNNYLLTYFMAYRISQIPTYKYDHWEDMINKVNKLAKDFIQVNNMEKADQQPFMMNKTTLNLFRDWGVYGDGVCYADIDIVGVFDSSQEQPFSDDSKKYHEIGQKITPEVGSCRGTIAHMDTDSQLMSRWIGNKLNIAKCIRVDMQSVEYRDLVKRFLQWGKEPNTCFSADWYIRQKGPIVVDKQPKQYKIINNMYNRLKDPQQILVLRMSHMHYNVLNKMSKTFGFLELVQKDAPPTEIFSWRKIRMMYKQMNPQQEERYMTARQLSKGVLLNICSGIVQTLDEKGIPHLPSKIRVSINTIKYSSMLGIRKVSKTAQQITIDNVEELMHKRCGLVFLRGWQLPTKQLIQGQLVLDFKPVDNKPHRTIVGLALEPQYSLDILDRFKTNECFDVNRGKYGESISFDIFCTHKGQPYSGQLTLNFISYVHPDLRGTQNYKDRSQVKRNIQLVIDRLEEYKGKTVEDVVDQVYGGQQMLAMIEQQSRKAILSFTPDHSGYIIPGKPDQHFKMLIDGAINQNTFKVKFHNGYGKFTVRLNERLTDMNNPRREIFDSLCLCGRVSHEGGSATLFCGQFYEHQTGMIHTVKEEDHHHFNETVEKKYDKADLLEECRLTDRKLRCVKPLRKWRDDMPQEVDWVNDVGPVLRTNALVYPAMQRLVNMFQFKLQMDGMKRVFSIEDLDNIRYMPSTRDMSPHMHRKILRWLYSQTYNKRVLNPGWHSMVITPMHHLSITKQSKITILKSQLWDAFRLEFSTIPLYLSALYSLKPRSPASILINSVIKDQMKHLMIVTNILMALGQKISFKDNAPKFPLKPRGIYTQPRNPKLKIQFQLLPCTPQQLIKFMMIEFPSESGNLRFGYVCHDCQSDEELKTKEVLNKRIEHLNTIFNQLNEQLKNNRNFITAGRFYRNIENLLWDLQDEVPATNIFIGDKKRQFTYNMLVSMSPVYDYRSAIDQIRVLVEEGQGTNIRDIFGQAKKQSHFFKFFQVYSGCRVLGVQSHMPHGDPSRQELVIQIEKVLELQQQSEVLDVWLKKNIESVKEIIKKQEKSDTVETSTARYPNIYGPTAFETTYLNVVEMLDQVYNLDTGIQNYQIVRRQMLEDSIARMRQMSIIAYGMVRPNDLIPNHEKLQGIRPNLNIFSEQSQHKKSHLRKSP